MMRFRVWLEQRHPEFVINESFMDTMKGIGKGAALAGAGLLGLGGMGLGYKALTTPRAPAQQPQQTQKSSDWRNNINQSGRLMDSKMIEKLAKQAAVKRFGEEPERIEMMTMREYISKQWGSRWGEVEKRAQNSRVQSDMKRGIPDIENLDAPVAAVYYPPIKIAKAVGSQDLNIQAYCSIIPLGANQEGKEVTMRVCVLPTQERDDSRPEEFRHSLQHSLPGGKPIENLVVPDFPFEKLAKFGNDAKNYKIDLEYNLKANEFWVKMAQAKQAYYKATGEIPKNGDAAEMLDFMIKRQSEFAGPVKNFMNVLQLIRNVDSNYFNKIIEKVDLYLDELVKSGGSERDQA